MREKDVSRPEEVLAGDFGTRHAEGRRSQRVEIEVVAGVWLSMSLGPYEGWIAADPFRRGVRVLACRIC